MEEGDRFIKIGERIIEITGFDGTYVYGTYTEVYKEEYADYSRGSNSYSLKLDLSKYQLEATDASGNVIQGYMYLEMGRVECHITSEKPGESVVLYNSTFNKVFEE